MFFLYSRYYIPGYTGYIHLLHMQPMQHRGPVGPPPFYGEAGILLKGTKIEQPQTRKNAKFLGIQNKCGGVVACAFFGLLGESSRIGYVLYRFVERTYQFKWSQDEINGIVCLDTFGYF